MARFYFCDYKDCKQQFGSLKAKKEHEAAHARAFARAYAYRSKKKPPKKESCTPLDGFK